MILIAAGILIAIGMMSVNRNPNPDVPVQGIPSAVLIFLSFIVVFDFIARRTQFGRYVFAVGGNARLPVGPA